MIYFIADTHFKHENILRFSKRPFGTIEEHDQTLIDNWNTTVSETDEVYILGDLTLSHKGSDANQLLSQLNGKKYLIKGNHEKYLEDPEFDQSQYEWIKDYYTFDYSGVKFVLFHYPILEWDGFFKKSVQLYGHVHNTRLNYFKETLDPRAINVGVDLIDFTPISISNIMKYFNSINTNK